MQTLVIKIINKSGLHTRAATKLVNQAVKFKSQIYLEKDGKRANAKSIMELFLIEAEEGSAVKLIADGPDEKEAIESLNKLIRERFGENE